MQKLFQKRTDYPKLWAGGDAVKYGRVDAISAIADGYNAAENIDAYFMKEVSE